MTPRTVDQTNTTQLPAIRGEDSREAHPGDTAQLPAIGGEDSSEVSQRSHRRPREKGRWTWLRPPRWFAAVPPLSVGLCVLVIAVLDDGGAGPVPMGGPVPEASTGSASPSIMLQLPTRSSRPVVRHLPPRPHPPVSHRPALSPRPTPTRSTTSPTPAPVTTSPKPTQTGPPPLFPTATPTDTPTQDGQSA